MCLAGNEIMKTRYLLFVYILLQGYLIPVQGITEEMPGKGQYTKEQVHGNEQECNVCHVSHKMKGAGLIKPVSELCIICHPERKKPDIEHVVDVIPAMDVGGLLLIEGKMTCVTCHDSHKNTFANMLRILPEKLCSSCHQH